VLSRPSMSPVPPRSRAPKRPWYLVAALIAGWMIGASAMSDGCNIVMFYRGDAVDVERPAQEITDVEARKQVIDLGARVIAARDAARNRLLPLGIASLLLGAAMVMFSARALSGRAGARGALVQVTVARAALVVASYFITSDVRAVELEHFRATAMALQRETARAKHIEDKDTLEKAERIMALMWKAALPTQLVLSSLVSALIVVGLTRRKSREFFEAAAGPLSEG